MLRTPSMPRMYTYGLHARRFHLKVWQILFVPRQSCQVWTPRLCTIRVVIYIVLCTVLPLSSLLRVLLFFLDIICQVDTDLSLPRFVHFLYFHLCPPYIQLNGASLQIINVLTSFSLFPCFLTLIFVSCNKIMVWDSDMFVARLTRYVVNWRS